MKGMERIEGKLAGCQGLAPRGRFTVKSPHNVHGIRLFVVMQADPGHTGMPYSRISFRL
jgi:hypothetical protein